LKVSHVLISNAECSCGETFDFETDLMKHIAKHLPEEVKEKQFNLFGDKHGS